MGTATRTGTVTTVADSGRAGPGPTQPAPKAPHTGKNTNANLNAEWANGPARVKYYDGNVGCTAAVRPWLCRSAFADASRHRQKRRAGSREAPPPRSASLKAERWEGRVAVASFLAAGWSFLAAGLANQPGCCAETHPSPSRPRAPSWPRPPRRLRRRRRAGAQ